MSALRRATVALAVVAIVQAALAQPASEQVSIGGAVKTPATLTVEQLRRLPADDLRSATVVRRVDGRESPTTVRGVPLTLLLERAQLSANDRNDWKHTVVVVTASDGYRVVFSWPELFNSDVGAGVLVVVERDGRPLTSSEGGIALVSAKDTRTGPRSVRWLTSIDVRVLDP